jgi:hypothetical protein
VDDLMRIEKLHRGGEISLPERADVLISEMIGNDPLGEQILETASDAAGRLLKPGALLIPSALRIHVLPMVVPAKVRQDAFFTPEALERWGRWYGLPFPALLDPGAEAAQVGLVCKFVQPWTARNWPQLGPPVLLQSAGPSAARCSSISCLTTPCPRYAGAWRQPS